MIFSTRQCNHIAEDLPFKKGRLLLKQFSDGELLVKIEEDVRDKIVWVIGSTAVPAENTIELMLLLDALQRAQARIYLVLTYFGYARQDRTSKGESLGSALFSTFLKSFNLEKIFIIHAHSPALHSFLDFENVIPVSLFCTPASGKDRIAAPDQGAYELAEAIAKTCNLGFITVTKMRPAHEAVEVTGVHNNIHQKRILIVDDIISTANTLISVAHILKDLGAHSIQAAATHGVFADGARERLQGSDLFEKVYVTDTLPQPPGYPKIVVLPIAPFIKKLIEEHTP